jgi:hypothetical protein
MEWIQTTPLLSTDDVHDFMVSGNDGATIFILAIHIKSRTDDVPNVRKFKNLSIQDVHEIETRLSYKLAFARVSFVMGECAVQAYLGVQFHPKEGTEKFNHAFANIDGNRLAITNSVQNLTRTFSCTPGAETYATGEFMDKKVHPRLQGMEKSFTLE